MENILQEKTSLHPDLQNLFRLISDADNLFIESFFHSYNNLLFLGLNYLIDNSYLDYVTDYNVIIVDPFFSEEREMTSLSNNCFEYLSKDRLRLSQFIKFDKKNNPSVNNIYSEGESWKLDYNNEEHIWPEGMMYLTGVSNIEVFGKRSKIKNYFKKAIEEGTNSFTVIKDCPNNPKNYLFAKGWVSDVEEDKFLASGKIFSISKEIVGEEIIINKGKKQVFDFFNTCIEKGDSIEKSILKSITFFNKKFFKSDWVGVSIIDDDRKTFSIIETSKRKKIEGISRLKYDVSNYHYFSKLLDGKYTLINRLKGAKTRSETLRIFKKNEFKSYLEFPILIENKMIGSVIFTSNTIENYTNHRISFGLEIIKELQDRISKFVLEEKLNNEVSIKNGILSVIPDLIVILDKDGYLKDFSHNPRKPKWSNLNFKIGDNILRVIGEESRNNLLLSFKEAIEKNELSTNIFKFNEEVVEARIYPISGDEIVVIATAITEKYLNERIELKTVINALDKERAQFSKELHDGIGQIMAAASINLEAALDPTIDEVKKKDTIYTAHNLLNLAITETRNVVFNLHPRTLKDIGLEQALTELISYNSTQFRAKINLRYELEDSLHLKQNIKSTIFRVVQEVVLNLNKVTIPKSINILINLNDDKNNVLIRVKDNGNGMIKEEIVNVSFKNKNKFQNIIARIKSVGGFFEIETEPNKPTSIYIDIPI